jgi:hypothetical protein
MYFSFSSSAQGMKSTRKQVGFRAFYVQAWRRRAFAFLFRMLKRIGEKTFNETFSIDTAHAATAARGVCSRSNVLHSEQSPRCHLAGQG